MSALYFSPFVLTIRFNHSFNITKGDSDDLMTFAGTVNKTCERFKIWSIADAQFKCFIFVCVSTIVVDEVQTTILLKIEKNPDITLKQVAVEYQWLMNLKNDLHIMQ